jgi:hypothetical protein
MLYVMPPRERTYAVFVWAHIQNATAAVAVTQMKEK